ncbi:MAG: DUF131 domain-containing protein [Acidilobaceae archaeon]
MVSWGELVAIGIALVFIGMLLIFVGTFFSVLEKGKVEGGGVLIIGPIPIIFGSSPRIALLAALMALAITVLVFLIYWRASP